jgi:HPt (histidine-containing phosphotransfer) domain-containing protein
MSSPTGDDVRTRSGCGGDVSGQAMVERIIHQSGKERRRVRGQPSCLLPSVCLISGKVTNDCKGLVSMGFVMIANGSPRTGTDAQSGVLDEEHLGRMTLGDRRLEREVLEIFVRHTATVLNLILDRVAERDPAGAAAAAHTMVGSARGVGAWRVAEAAERLERAVDAGGEQQMREAITALRAASLEVNTVIGMRWVDPGNRTADCA